jgi:hypothetical protein
MGCLIHQRRQSEEKARCGDSRLLGGTLWRRIALEGGTSMNDNPADGPAQSKIPPRDQDKPANVKPPLSFTFYRDIDPRPRKDWLIQNFIGQGELSCLYGHPGSSKSTIAGDLACHIAAKMNWFGRYTSQGGVLYVAAERVAVVKRRLAAFRKHHDLDDIPLAVVGGPADLRTSPAHAKLIVEYAARLEIDAKLPTVLIIIETINRVLAGGDENSSKDMGQLVRNLTDIQERTGAHILTVHHMPVDGERMRGHGSLLGACDVTVRAEKRSAMFTATIEKSNDGPTGERVAFTLKSVDLHHDEGACCRSNCRTNSQAEQGKAHSRREVDAAHTAGRWEGGDDHGGLVRSREGGGHRGQASSYLDGQEERTDEQAVCVRGQRSVSGLADHPAHGGRRTGVTRYGG